MFEIRLLFKPFIMTPTLSVSLLLCSLSVLFPKSAADEYLNKQLSLTVPYQGSGMTIPFWEFYGSTIVTQSFIRLTPDEQSRVGGLYNRIPVHFPNWEVQLHFKVSGSGKDMFGDGFAFWYVKEPLVSGHVFGNKDFFTGLGIFFDTYANQNGAHSHGHPYISAMVNNGSMHYDHDRDGTHTELSGCECRFRNLDVDTYAAIKYENDIVTVNTYIDGKGEWKECFRVTGVTLPTGYLIGVSAITGDLSDNHDIISIKTYELPPPVGSDIGIDRSKLIPSAESFAAPRERIDDQPQGMSRVKLFFIVLFVILMLVVFGAVGVMYFQRQQETSRKRFY